MKKLILTAIAVTCAVGVFAQGTVTFNNRVAGSLITHVYLGGTAQVVGNGPTDIPAGTTDWAGYTGLANLPGGSVYMAQLLAAPGSNAAEGSLVGAQTTTFRTTTGGAGWVNAITATLNNVAADASVATIEMVAWDNTSGLYPTWTQARSAWLAGTIAAGASGTFNLSAIGGAINNPPNLTGLQSFNIYSTVVPEPATFALLGLGGAAMLIFRRRK